MEYRKLAKGTEQISVLGIGMGGIQKASDAEIEAVVRAALDNGINYFDLCAGGKNVYAPFARAIRGRRERVLFQLHFGAVYNEKGEYAWSRNMDEIRRTFDWEMETLGTEYVDFGFLHCVDEEDDYDALVNAGVLNYLRELHNKGVVRHIGFSSHTPDVANRIIDEGFTDMMMFSVNPAYDYERSDAYGAGSAGERAALLRRCAAEGVGVSVMKPFFAGKLLTDDASPFGKALTHAQCIQYALDRPGVLTVLPGVRGMDDLNEVLRYLDSSREERDYAALGGMTAHGLDGNCVYCNHCQPCPAGIDVGTVNRYYDLAMAGDTLAISHYDKLSVKAEACVGCGHCDSRCPFGVKQSERMREIDRFFYYANE